MKMIIELPEQKNRSQKTTTIEQIKKTAAILEAITHKLVDFMWCFILLHIDQLTH